MAEKDVRRRLYDKLKQLYGEDMDFGPFDEFKEAFNDENSIRNTYRQLVSGGIKKEGFLGSEDNFVGMFKDHLDQRTLDNYAAKGQFMPRSDYGGNDYIATLLDEQNKQTSAQAQRQATPEAKPAPIQPTAAQLPARNAPAQQAKPAVADSVQPAPSQPSAEPVNPWANKTGYNPATWNPGQLYTPNPETEQIMGQLGKFGQAPEQPKLEQPDLRSQLFGKKRTELDLSLGEEGRDLSEMGDDGEKYEARAEQINNFYQSDYGKKAYDRKMREDTLDQFRELGDEIKRLKAESDKELNELNKDSGLSDWVRRASQLRRSRSLPLSGKEDAYSEKKADWDKQRGYIDAADNIMGDTERILKASMLSKLGEGGSGMKFKLGMGEVDAGTAVNMGANVLNGFVDGVFNIDNWTLGISDMLKNFKVLSVLEKTERGEELTDSEETLMQSLLVNLAASATYGSDLTRMYKAGMTFGESIPFMVQMATGTELVGGATTVASKGMVKYAKKWLSKAVNKKAAEEISKKVAADATRKAAKDVAGKTAMKKATETIGSRLLGLGKEIGKGAAISVVNTATFDVGRVGANYLEREIGDVNFDFDSDGNITYAGRGNMESGGYAWLKSFLATAKETQSEYMGETFAPAFNLLGRLISKVPGIRNIASSAAVKSLRQSWKASKSANNLKSFMQQTQWHGIPGEYAEEVWGNLLSCAWGDMSKEELLDVNNNIDTFLGVALSGVVMGGVSGAAYMHERGKARRYIERFESQYGKSMDVNSYREWAANASLEDIREELKRIGEDPTVPEQQRRDQMRYLYSLMLENTYQVTSEDEAEEQAQPEQTQVTEALQAAYDEGADAEESEQRTAIRKRVDDARKALMKDENDPNEQQFASIVEENKDKPSETFAKLRDQGYDAEHVQRALDYYNASAAYNGMLDSIEEGVDADVQRQMKEVDANTHENGMMIQGRDGKSGRTGYIVHGNVATNPDGTLDRNNTDELIIMRDEQTGEQFFVRPDDLTVGETINPEEKKTWLDTEYRQQQLQREAERADYPDEVVDHVPTEGEQLTLNGQTYTVAGVENEGRIGLIQADEKGNPSYVGSIDRDSYLKALAEQMGVQNGRQQTTEQSAAPTDEASAPTEEQTATPTAEEVPPTAPVEEQPAESEEEAMQATIQDEESPEAKEKEIPVDEFGNPKYEDTDADTAYDAILKEAESDAVAASVIDGTIEELEADLKAKQKEKVKVTQKGNVKERIAAEKKKQQEIAAIQKKLDAWEAIQGVPAARKRAEEEAALAQQQAERQAAVEAARKKAEEEAKQPPVDTENAPEWTVDKPEDARKRGFRMVGSEKVERQQPVEGLQGKETAARFAEGKKPNGAYFVMEAGQLQPSHIQGQRNPLHFIPEAQPKDRKDNASVLASQKIAQEMNPEEITSMQTAYTGAPTVNARGEVIQGNNRSDALKFMYQQGGEQAAAYKQYLMDHAGEFGLKREDIEKMENPVLVNRVDVSDEEAIELGQYNAADTESGGTERIKSQQTIQKLGSRVSSFINILMKGGEDMTLSELLAQNGVQALKWLAQNGIITNTQIESAVQPSGALTEDAVADLKNVLFDTVFQGAPSGLKEFFNNMPSKVQRAILGTAYRDNASPEGSRIREHLQSAMMAFTTLMSDKDFAAAKTLQEARAALKMWANQYVIDETTGKSLLNSSKFNNFALELAARFKTSSQKAQQELLNQLFNLVQGKQESMFDEARGPVALADAIKEVFGIDFKEKENGQNGSLSVAGNDQGGTQRQPGEPAGTESGEQRPQGEGTPVSGGGTDVDGTNPGESDLAEDTALAARFTETDEEEEENLPSGTVYRKTYLLDGKHKVTKVDEPDSKGHYHGSVYKAFGKTFSDLKEVADYADLKSVEEDFGFDNDIQSKFKPIEGSETDEEVDGVQTHSQKFKYRGFIVAKVDEKDADGTTQSRYTFSGYNYPSLQEVADAVDRRIPTFIFSEEEERTEKDQEAALDISPIRNAVVTKTDDGTEERSSWVFNNSYARLEKVVEKDKDGNITGAHYEGYGRRFDSLSDAYKFKSEEYELIGEHWSSATRMEDDGKGRTGRTITIDNNHEVKYSFVEDGLTRNDERYEFNGKTYLNMHDLMDAIEKFDKQEKNSNENSAVDNRFKQVSGEIDGYDSIRKEYVVDGKYSVTEITKKESDGTLGETVYQAYNKEFKSREELVKFLDKEDTLLFAHLTDEKKEQEPQLMMIGLERSHAKAYSKYDITIDTETTGDGVIVSRNFGVFGIEFGSFTDFCDAVSKMSSNLKRWRDEVEASGTEGVYYETKYGKEEMVVTEVPGDMWTGPQYQVRSGANTRIVEEDKIGLLIASGEWIPLRLSSDEKQEREQKKARLKEIEKLKGKTFTDGENTYLIEGINNGMVNVMFNDQVKTVYNEAQVYNDIQSGKWKDVNETEDKAPQPEQPTEDQPTDESNKPGKKGTKKTPKAKEKPSEENSQKEILKKPEETREEVELTEEDIRKANVPEEMKTAAIAYVKGNRNVFAQLAYQTVKDYVRNQSRDSSTDSREKDPAQLGEGTDGTPGGTSRPGRGQGVQVDNADNGETTPGGRPGGESSQTDVAPSDGVEGDRGLSPLEPSVPVDNTGDGNTRAGGRGGKKRADGTQRGGRKGGTRLPGKDAGRGTETQRGGNHSVDEEISQVEQDILDALKDSFLPKRDRLYDVTTLMAGLGVNAFKILGLTLKLGGLYIKKGFYDYKKWKQNMHKSLDKALAENTTFTPEDIEEYISECWNAAYEMDGETHLISEWADKLGREELKKKMKLSIEEKRKLQMEAEKVETIIGDIDNIREALPFLLPKQQEDVQKAEVQFFDESHKDDAHGNGKGYLFTNGTGTGKTYTGLGIVKRFLKQGKKRILIVTAQDSKIKDFIRDAKNLGIEASMLQDTKDKGQGVVVTQYANMYQNMALLEDTFDLIIYDESHKLQENKSGHSTARARQHHMLANRDPQQAILRKLQNTELFRRGREMEDKYDYMEDVLQEYRNSTYDQLSPEVRKEVESYGGEKAYEDAISALKLAIENNHKQQEEETKKAMADPKQFEEAKKDVERTKVVFLSATPFNTAMSLDYTESYIFSYPDKPKEGVYESPEERVTRQGTFVMDTFPSSHKRNNSGIVSRVGEAQISDPEKSGEEEIGFSDRLQHELNTMSGRQLDSEYDYSREFPLLSDPVSKRVNQAINDITSGKYIDLEKFFKNILSDYPNMTAVFEIIKTQQSIPRIKEHLAKGRKVAIYHRRMSSSKGITPPFATGIHGALLDPKTKDLAAEFIEEYKDLFAWERTIPFDKFPNEIIMEAFATEEEKAKHKEEMEKWRKKKAEFDRSGKKKGMPKPPRLQAAAVAEFNGQVTDAKKELARNAFNDDNSPCKLIVCQISAAKEGIDLHDKTSKHQRAMMVLSLPESPIEFVQVEGRIYRVGSKSNAIFEYPLLGIDLEVASFAMKINGRSQTSDNLALGSESRGLRDSIARAVLASRDIPVTDNMGTGGKMLDDRQQQKKSGYEDAVKNFEQWQGEPFPESFDDMEVPDPLGYKMGEWAKSENGETVLVPGAKRGSIADYIPAKSRLVALEPMMEWFAKLQVKLGGGGRKILDSSFEDYSSVNKADAVVMNLAHGKGKNASLITKTQDSENIAKALYHLEEGGRVVAVVDGNFDYSAQKFDKAFALSAEIRLPDFLFNGNKSKIIIIDKVTDNELRKAMPEKQTIDLSGYQTYETFFRNLKTVDVPKRTIDDLARIGKRVGGAGKKFGENPLIKKEKNWQTDKMGPSVCLWREGFSANFRKSLIPYVNREGGVSWNYGVHLKFESIRTGDTDVIESLARTYLFLSKMLKLNQQDFEEELQNRYKYPQSNEVMAYRDAFSVYRSVIEAALGKTPLQIKNLAEGKVENELSGEMTVDEFEDAFRSYNNGNAQMAALADKVFAIIKQIPGLKFRVVTDASNFGHNAIAHYAPAKNAIELNNKYINSTRYLTEEQKGQTLVHEMIHAATCYLMSEYEHNGGVNLTEKQKQACEDIFKVYDALKEDEAFRASLRLGTKISDNSEYGMENAYEMVAELANPVFRAKLKAKKLFKQLINNMMILFGMKLPGAKVKGETDALTIVEHAMYDLLDSFDVDQYNNYVGSDYAREAPVFARKVTDEKLINELEKTPKIRLFRSMQLIAGKLYPPMAAKVKGKLVEPSEIGQWEQADEHPELIKDKNGKKNFTLNKGNGSQIDAAYNPYLHLSRSPLNDQFTSASKRPNLVTVEMEAPESELYSRYKAEGAKDAVGEMTWHAGPVSGKLPKDKKRKVVLSRWAKPVRIVPDKEVAERIAEILKGEDIAIPSNTVTPSLRKELEKQGVKVRDTEKRYRFIGEKGARAIDKAREADDLILNLSKAREMEKSDVDARSIKLATGWERGADGKWRYEQMDATFNLEGRKDGDVVNLSDITSDQELFESYPELKDVKVEFYEENSLDYGGYSDEENKIYINLTAGEAEGTLIHELQHIIQGSEGFALGGSPSSQTAITPEERAAVEKEAADIKKGIEDLEAKIEERKKKVRAIDEKRKENFRRMDDGEISMEEGKKIARQLNEERAKAESEGGYETELKNAQWALRSKESFLKRDTKSIGLDGYRRLAGEVESRNVESRRKMTQEERKASLAADTEDEAREEQITLFERLGVDAKTIEDVSDEDRQAIWRYEQMDATRFTDKAKEKGFDGIESESGHGMNKLHWYVAFDPKQIINVKPASEEFMGVREPEKIHQTVKQDSSIDDVSWDTDYAKKIIGKEIIGYRYGKAPEQGRSYNYLEKSFEDGVSMAKVGYTKEIGSFAVDDAAANRKKYYYIGIINGYGGDGEITMKDVKPIAYSEYKKLLPSYTDVSNMVAKAFAEKKLRLISKGYIIGKTEEQIHEELKKYLKPSVNDNNSLVGLHNIFESKLESALDLGGLANPSAAIVDLNKQGHNEFGAKRLDNLAVARQMEQAGEDAKAVKLATGWERGTDGKWRFEQMDNAFHAEARNVQAREDQNILYDVSDEDRKALESVTDESSAVYSDPAYSEAFSTQNVNQAIYSMAGKYLKRLYANGMLGRVLTGPYATIDREKAKADYKKAKEILSGYREELENMMSSCTEAAKADIQAVIDKIDRSIDYYKKLAEGKDVWRTDERSRYRLLDVVKMLSSFAKRHSHLRMTEHAVSLAESLGTKIRIVSNLSELSEEDREAKGWYDTETGEVVIVVPNHTDIDDIEETVFHEIVGHKGMKDVFGEKGFNQILNDIYMNCTEEIRTRISRKMMNGGLDYLTATEEVIAEIAEGMAGGKKMNGMERFIDTIRAAIRNALQKLGFDGAVKYSEGDLLYMLWNNRRKMEKGDIVGFAKQQQMQRGLNADFEGKRYRRRGPAPKPSSVRDVYDESVRGMGYRFREAYQDSMLSLKNLQEAIVKASGKKMEEWEDAYTAENQLSSKNTLEMEIFTRDYYNPLIKAVKTAMDRMNLTREGLNKYLFGKSGLERNREFAVRDALRAVAGEENVSPDLEQAIEDYQTYRYNNKMDLDQAKITFREFCEKMDEEAKFLIGLTLVDKDGKPRVDAHGEPIDVDAYCDALLSRDYSGISSIYDADNFKEDAIQFVEDKENMNYLASKDLWATINACTGFALKKSKDSGTISVEQYSRVKNMMDWYIPMRGFNDTTAKEVYDYVGEEGVFSPTLKAAKGRLSLADDPLAVMMNMANSAIMHGNKNLMKVNLLNLAMNHPTKLLTVDYAWVKNTGTEEDPVWEYAYPDIQEDDDAETIAQKMQDFKDEMNDLKEQGMAKQVKEKLKLPYIVTPDIVPEHIIRVKRNGKEFTIILNGNPRAAQAVNGTMDKDKRKDYGLSFMSKVNRWMAANFTTRSATFVARNLTRDALFGNAAVFMKENRAYRRRFRKNEIRVAASIAGLLARHKAGRLDENKSLDKAFKEFLEGGGETGFVQLMSVEEFKEKMQKDLKKRNAVNAAVVNGAKSLMNAIEFANRCAEDYTRFTVFLTSRQMGRSIKRSASDAKEITVNFNKRGAGSATGGFIGYSAETMKTFYIFANAAIQSLNNFGKMAKQHPGKMAAMVGTMYAMGLVTPMMNEILISALGGGDDDPYNNLPDYVRHNHLCIYIGDGNFVTIPLPIELRALYGLGESIYQVTKGNLSEGDAALVFSSGMCELLPVNFADEAGIADALTPTAVAPLVEAFVLNKNFTGRPIYKDNGFNKRDPEWTKAYSGTSKALVAACKAANEATGGDNVKSGIVDFNPAMIEFLVSAYFGGFGQNFTDLSKTIQAACGVEDYRNTRNIPIAKAFIRQADERNTFAKSRENYERYRDWYEGKTHDIGGYKKQVKMGGEMAMDYADKLKDELEGKDRQKFLVMKAANRVLGKLYKLVPMYDSDEEKRQMQRIIDLIKVQAVEKCKAADRGEIVEDDEEGLNLDWLDGQIPEPPKREEE